MASTAVVVGGGLAAVGGAFYLYRRWVSGGVCTVRKDLSGQVAVVTGGNAGIGYQTSLELARQGAHVVLACRNPALGKQAVDDINKELLQSAASSASASASAAAAAASGNNLNNNKPGKVEFLQLDLADLSSVRTFAKEFQAKKLPLHLLINNAGVMAIQTRTFTKDGFETQFGVNHLGHFLLTNLLLPVLRETAASDKKKSVRVVNLSSLASEPDSATIDFDNLQGEKAYDPVGNYRQSKLANLLFTRELARREKEANSGVTTYALHPGVVGTDLGKNFPAPIWAIVSLPGFRTLLPFKTVWQGTQTSLYCALADIEQHSGLYFADCAVKKNPNPLAYNDEVAKKLWEVSEKLVNI